MRLSKEEKRFLKNAFIRSKIASNNLENRLNTPETNSAFAHSTFVNLDKPT